MYGLKTFGLHDEFTHRFASTVGSTESTGLISSGSFEGRVRVTRRPLYVFFFFAVFLLTTIFFTSRAGRANLVLFVFSSELK